MKGCGLKSAFSQCHYLYSELVVGARAIDALSGVLTLDGKVRILGSCLGRFISELAFGSARKVEGKNEREKWDEFLHGLLCGLRLYRLEPKRQLWENSRLFVQQKGFCFRRLLIFPAVEEQHAINDASIRPEDRLDIVVAPAGIVFLTAHQVTGFFPAIALVL